MTEKQVKPDQLRKRNDGQVVPIKFGAFGGQGSGKSYTAAMLSLGLSIQLHNRAPVYVYDTEPGWQFFKKIFAIEKVELIQEAGERFDDLRRAREKAEKVGACVFIGDSYTHIWLDLMKGFMSSAGFVEFQDWNAIKKMWRDWTREFLNTKLHCGALGRLGWNYTPEEGRGGKIKMVKSDSKFNAGGGESFGYEPHLLIELELGRDDTTTGRGGTVIHQATVLKDRTQAINGTSFEFESSHGYKAGDYAHVWNAIAPHVQEMQDIQSHVLIPAGTVVGSKQDEDGDSEYYRTKKQRTALVEEWDATMNLLWGGSSADVKRVRQLVGERITTLRSRTKFEALPLPKLQYAVELLRLVEERIKKDGMPGDEADVIAVVDMTEEDLKLQISAKDAEVVGLPF